MPDLTELLQRGAGEAQSVDVDAVLRRADRLTRRRTAARIGVVVSALAILASLVAVTARSGNEVISTDQDERGVLEIPAVGETTAVFLDNGEPVFVVYHRDQTVSVIDATDPHQVEPHVEELAAWCPSARGFTEVRHGTQYDEWGRFMGGPSPRDLDTYKTSVDPDDPTKVHVGPRIAATGRSKQPAQTAGPWCADVVDADNLTGHEPLDAVTLEQALARGKPGWVAVKGAALVGTDAGLRVCDDDITTRRGSNGDGDAPVTAVDCDGPVVVDTTSGHGDGGVMTGPLFLRVEDGVIYDVAPLVQGVVTAMDAGRVDAYCELLGEPVDPTIDVAVFFMPNTPSDVITAAADELRADPGVLNVEVITESQADYTSVRVRGANGQVAERVANAEGSKAYRDSVWVESDRLSALLDLAPLAIAPAVSALHNGDGPPERLDQVRTDIVEHARTVCGIEIENASLN